MQQLFLVGVGGFLGSVGRYVISDALARGTREGGYPWGTLVVNAVDCFLIGWLTQLGEGRWSISDETRLLLFTGLLGGFTTFSAFGQETLKLWQNGQSLVALAHVAAHLICGLGAAWLGHVAAGR